MTRPKGRQGTQTVVVAVAAGIVGIGIVVELWLIAVSTGCHDDGLLQLLLLLLLLLGPLLL